MKCQGAIVAAVLLVALLSGCITSGEGPGDTPSDCVTVAECYAEEIGYCCERRSGEYGDYTAVVFSDGSYCDVWEFYWGRCGEKWQTEYLKDFIEVRAIREWPNEITVSGHTKILAMQASEKGYYVVEKDSKLDTLEIYSPSGEMIWEIRVFINDAWKEELALALDSCY